MKTQKKSPSRVKLKYQSRIQNPIKYLRWSVLQK